MGTKSVFESSIRRAVEGIRSGGQTLFEEEQREGGFSRRVVRLDLWRAPATVSDYRESDFSDELSVDRLEELTGLVSDFRELTETFDPTGPVPEEEGAKADELILQINEIIA